LHTSKSAATLRTLLNRTAKAVVYVVPLGETAMSVQQTHDRRFRGIGESFKIQKSDRDSERGPIRPIGEVGGAS
jgi:hypothetical protein